MYCLILAIANCLICPPRRFLETVIFVATFLFFACGLAFAVEENGDFIKQSCPPYVHHSTKPIIRRAINIDINRFIKEKLRVFLFFNAVLAHPCIGSELQRILRGHDQPSPSSPLL